MRRTTQQQFARASRHVAAFVTAVLVAVVAGLFFGGLALAQEAVVGPPPTAPTDATSVLGWIFKGVLTLAVLAGGWAAVKLSGLLAAKTNQAGQNATQAMGWSVVNRVWLKTQAIGGKLLAKEKPLLDKILSDGIVTAEEFNQFKTAIVADLREIAAEEIPLLKSLMAGGSESGVTTILEGFASKVAHSLISGQAGAPTQTPGGAPPVSVVPSPQ